MSVFRQLDVAQYSDVEAMGRVTDPSDNTGQRWIVGKHVVHGTLVRACLHPTVHAKHRYKQIDETLRLEPQRSSFVVADKPRLEQEQRKLKKWLEAQVPLVAHYEQLPLIVLAGLR